MIAVEAVSVTAYRSSTGRRKRFTKLAAYRDAAKLAWRQAYPCITRQQLALRPRSARALRRAWHRGEQHPSALRRAALWWALEALRCYPSAAEVPRG